ANHLLPTAGADKALLEGEDLVAGDRPGQVIALQPVAVCQAQEGGLPLGLNAFGNDRHPERLAEVDDRGKDRRSVMGGIQTGNEAAIDLQRVERELAQIAQARIAGAEVVE